MKAWRRFVLIVWLSLSLTLSGQNLSAQVAPEYLVQQAQQKYEREQSLQALKLLQQAGNIYQAQKRILPQAQVLALTSLVQQQQQKWELARTSLEDSLTSIKSVPNSESKIRVTAQIENTQGHYWFATGQYSQALASWQQAKNLYRQLKDDTGTTGILLSQAETLGKLGFYRRACDRTLEILDRHLSECKNLQSQSIESILANAQLEDSLLIDSLLSIGNSLLSMGKLSLAQQFIQASQDRSSLSSLNRNRAKVVLSLGNLNRAIALQARELNDSDSFRSHSQQAIEYFQRLQGNFTANRTESTGGKAE